MKNLLNKLKIGLAGLAMIGFSYSNLNAQENQTNQNKYIPKYLKEKIKKQNADSLNLNLIEEYNFSKKSLKKYNNLVIKAFTESEKKNSAIVLINKSEYTLYLIDSGKVKLKFPIELGEDPYGDKLYEGDGCTPEGEYIALKKIKEPLTAFHKAFLLNYPNKKDRVKRKTGSLIEIHGNGSGSRPTEDGYNWTAGCIALSDEDIDKLYASFEKNDKIIIVKYTSIKF